MVKLDSIFHIEYGQHDLSSKDSLEAGHTIVISSQGTDHGCYGFFDVPAHYDPPVISVPRTGSIGEAFVQLEPCCIDDNCLVLIPKHKLGVDYLLYVCAQIRAEKWRYMYGRQITPTRLGSLELVSQSKFKIKISRKILRKVKSEISPGILRI